MIPQQVPLSKYSVSFGLSLAITSVANAILVVAKEKSTSLQARMKSLTGHHWITHSVAILGLFFILGFVLARMNGGQGFKVSAGRLVGTLLYGVMIGGLLIMGFYLFAD